MKILFLTLCFLLGSSLAIGCQTFIQPKSLNFGSEQIEESSSIQKSLLEYLSQEEIDAINKEFAFFNWIKLEAEQSINDGVALDDFSRKYKESISLIGPKTDNIIAQLEKHSLDTGEPIPEELVVFYEKSKPVYDQLKEVINSEKTIEKVRNMTDMISLVEPFAINALKILAK